MCPAASVTTMASGATSRKAGLSSAADTGGSAATAGKTERAREWTRVSGWRAAWWRSSGGRAPGGHGKPSFTREATLPTPGVDHGWMVVYQRQSLGSRCGGRTTCTPNGVPRQGTTLRCCCQQADGRAEVDSHPLLAWAARLSALWQWRNRQAPVIQASTCAPSFAVTYTSLVFTALRERDTSVTL